MSQQQSPAVNNKQKRIIILPGNGCTNVWKSNWYGWLANRLKEEGFTDVVLENMPDPYTARESIWVPFVEQLAKGAEDRIVLVGHSSGAECAMRFAETHKLHGLVLVSACYTDLGIKNERESGYYSRPWQWETIRSNLSPAFGVVQFHSSDDPWIPMSEATHVANHLCSERHFFDDKSHFFEPFEEIVTVLKIRLRSSLGL